MGRTSDAKERLLEAIYDLMWERSYSSLTIDQICKAADVKKGSFYYYFKSKTELAIESLDVSWQEMRAKLDTIYSASKDPLQRLFDHADYALEKVRKIQKDKGRALGCPFTSMSNECACVEPELAEKIEEINQRYLRYIGNAIREAIAEKQIDEIDPDEAVRLIDCLYDGMMSQARMRNDPEILRDLKPGFQRILGLKQDGQLVGK